MVLGRQGARPRCPADGQRGQARSWPGSRQSGSSGKPEVRETRPLAPFPPKVSAGRARPGCCSCAGGTIPGPVLWLGGGFTGAVPQRHRFLKNPDSPQKAQSNARSPASQQTSPTALSPLVSPPARCELKMGLCSVLFPGSLLPAADGDVTLLVWPGIQSPAG